jgi:hypothetical protein
MERSVLIISDFHAPYNHQDAADFLSEVKKKYKPSLVVSVGDEVDYHNISFHDSDPDLPGAADELELAIEQLQPLYRMFPKLTIVDSNHGSMVVRKAIANGLPRAFFKNNREILRAPKGWVWYNDFKFTTPLGPVYVCHGKSATAGRLTSQYGMSCIQGHFHERSQIHYISTPERLMFDMHVGCLVDDDSLAMGYNKVNPKRPIVSVGVVVNGIPQLIPMVLNKKGRWIGDL